MLTRARREATGHRARGVLVAAGVACALAAGSVSLLRGARSVHLRPPIEMIGAEGAAPGMTIESTDLGTPFEIVGTP